MIKKIKLHDQKINLKKVSRKPKSKENDRTNTTHIFISIIHPHNITPRAKKNKTIGTTFIIHKFDKKNTIKTSSRNTTTTITNPATYSLLEAASDARFRLLLINVDSTDAGMKIIEFRFIKRDLGMLSFVMDLHRFKIRSSNLAERTLELGVSTFFSSSPIR